MEYKNRILLLMKYNTKKTLTENKEILLTESVISPFTKLLRSLVSLADETLESVINKTKPEIEQIINKSRKTAADFDEIFNSITDFKTLASKLFYKNGIFNPRQQKILVDTITDSIALDPKKYAKSIDSITESLMSLGRFPTSAKPLIEEYSKLVVRKQVKQSLKIKYPEVYEKLFPSNPISKIDWSQVTEVTPSIFSRFLASNKTLGTRLRLIALQLSKTLPIFDTTSGKWYFPFKSSVDKTITDIFGKLKTIVNKYEEGAGFGNTLIDSDSLFRDIQASLGSLQKGIADYDKIIGEIEDVMLDGGVDSDTVSKIGRYIKENDPWIQNSWLRTMIGESSFAKAIKEIWGPSKNSIGLRWYEKMWNLFERTIMFLTTGSIKKWDEILEFMIGRQSPGIAKGVLYYYLFMMWVSKGVLPVVLSFFGALLAMAKGALFGYQNDRFVNELEKQYKEYWKKMTTAPDGDTNYLRVFIPWESFWGDINRIADGLISGTINIGEIVQKYVKNANQKAMEELKIGMEDLNKLKKEYEQMKQDNVKDTDNSPTIDTFYNYIYSLDNKVGKADLPYMKQDPTNKNKFTFEACLNPPDCNRTELRTYVFDGTTFVKE